MKLLKQVPKTCRKRKDFTLFFLGEVTICMLGHSSIYHAHDHKSKVQESDYLRIYLNLSVVSSGYLGENQCFSNKFLM